MLSYIISVALIFSFIVNDDGNKDLPAWAESYGADSPYPSQTHLTGFGMSPIEGSEDDALESARTQAASDLIRKIRTNVVSSVTSEVSEVDGEVSDRFSSVSKTVSNLEIEGIEIEIVQDQSNYYALAWVERAELADSYISRLKKLQARIDQGLTSAQKREESGNTVEALEQYLKIRPLISGYLENYALFRVVRGDVDIFMSESTDELESPNKIAQLDNELASTISSLFDQPVNALDDGFELLARQFEMQDVASGELKVNDFNYQDSDFSSQFGAFAARQLNSQCVSILPDGDQQLIIRSMYWDEGDAVKVISLAQDLNGNELGSAEIQLPKDVIPSTYELKPRNAAQAMMDQKVMSEEGLTEGGINVDAWTNKGRSEDNLVFTPSDEVQMYFRVNQPSHLRLSYILSDGTKILLIDDFYIGLDQVNQVVKAPFSFVPSPPFGVERMIITAYSKEPPSVATTSKTIDGETYDNVIEDELDEMMAKTRGIKIKSNEEDEMRVGETTLTMTMVSE